jgi:hypothetical protein
VRVFCAAMDTQCRWCDHLGGAAVCFQRLVTPGAGVHDLPVPVPWKAWLLLLKTKCVGPCAVLRL